MPEEYKFPDEEQDVQQDEQLQETDIDVEEDVEVEVVDDTPEQDRGRKPLAKDVDDPSDEEIAEYGDKVQKRMRELTHARHDERRAKEAALREREEAVAIAQKLIEENKKLRSAVNTGNQEFVKSIQSRADLELEIARKKLRDAQESYDNEAILAAQEALTEAKFRQQQAKILAPKPLQEPEEPVYTQNIPQQIPEPDQQALRWQDQNRWFGQDDEMTSLALAVHKKLVETGYDPRSREYYERIDARMREVFPSYFGEARKSETKRPATVVAPATRTAGKKQVTLTKTQAALARKLGLTNEQYAREITKLSSEA